MTLLNLPEQIEQFGPLQDYWDGSQDVPTVDQADTGKYASDADMYVR